MSIHTCAFTGHRPSAFSFGYDEAHPDCVRLRRRLAEEVRALAGEGVTTFLSGMALGVDLWGAQAVLTLKRELPALRLVAAVPFRAQPGRWSAGARQQYYTLLAQCDETVCFSERFTKTCMHERNRWMVRQADVLLAVYNGSGTGGTAYTVRCALSAGKQLRLLDPETLRLQRIPGREDEAETSQLQMD